MNVAVCTCGGSGALVDMVLSLEYRSVACRPAGPSAVPVKIRALTIINPLISLRSTLILLEMHMWYLVLLLIRPFSFPQPFAQWHWTSCQGPRNYFRELSKTSNSQVSCAYNGKGIQIPRFSSLFLQAEWQQVIPYYLRGEIPRKVSEALHICLRR